MGPDDAVVERQLGRPPRGDLRVAARCVWGYPTVVAVDPLLEPPRPGEPPEPFPTRWWLTCPVLVEQVSRLESDGLIGRLEGEIAGDPALAAALAGDHDRYAAARFGALEGRALEEAAGRGMLGVLRDTGVGGARDRGHLKCLHAHYAQHLVEGNAVGALLRERYAPRECPEEEVRCDAFGIPGTGPGTRSEPSEPRFGGGGP